MDILVSRLASRYFNILLVALLAGGVLAGCGRSEPGPDASAKPEPESVAQSATSSETETPATDLAGTEWRLLYFESMDDSIGRALPEPSQTYTMRLNADGTVNMALNCNRANGTWTIDPASDSVSGRFSFGPLASTKALCPPPSMDEQVVADAGYVRGFLLRDGNLYLSLMADAGIYAWGPASARTAGDVTFDRTPNPALRDAIREPTPRLTAEVVEMGGGAESWY
jgi:heat shock protein HslJ